MKLESGSTKELVIATSYQAANMLILSKEIHHRYIIISSNLKVYFDYLCNGNTVWMLTDNDAEELESIFRSVAPRKIIYWDYAMSELAIFIATYSKDHNIELELQLPSTVHEELYLCSDFKLNVALKFPKSLLKMFLQKIRGDQLKIKTFRGQLWYCIKEGSNVAVKLYSELEEQNYRNSKNFLDFSNALVTYNYSHLRDLFINKKIVVLIDEDVDFLTSYDHKQTKLLVCKLTSELNDYKKEGYRIYLKPANYGQCFLDRYMTFDSTLPAEIPLQVFDLVSQPNAIIAGFLSSYLNEKHLNFKPKRLLHLVS